ncbi:MAG: MFS transporter [Ignavibacteriae bacterium]|nr:MFS transporter [Ignavibacteriota bacterium]
MKFFSKDAAPKGEWQLLLVLAAVQFTNILDFVIMMPLGPQLMRVFSISPQEFGLAVSAYTFSAGTTGILGALFLDRFDRKTALLTLYGGFAVGTLLCAVAPTYGFLVAARVVAGAFGGVLGATVLAVVADVIPEARRGAAMGVIMTSFSAASVFGVPLGLYFANLYGWHMPFVLLAVSSAVLFALAYRVLPAMGTHKAHATGENPVRSLLSLLTHPDHLRTLAFMMTMIVAGFSVIPYIAPYMVSTIGFAEEDLPLVYFFGGGATIFTARYIGQLADRHGKLNVFMWIAGLSIIPILFVTNMPNMSLAAVLVVTTLFFILVSGRMTPAMAMVTATVEPRRRGSFMSLNASVQQLSAGIASYGAGLILGEAADGSLTNYGIVGILATAMTVLCIILARKLKFVEGVHIDSHRETVSAEASSPEVVAATIANEEIT